MPIISTAVGTALAALTSDRATWRDFAATAFDETPLHGRLWVQDDLSPDDARTEPLEKMKLLLGSNLRDLRQLDRKGGRGAAQGTRDLLQIDTAIIHQMAAILRGEDRVDDIPAHGAIDAESVGYLLQAIRAYMFAGHSLNRRGIHLEVSCRAAGIEGNPKTFWRSKKERARGIRPEDLWAEATDDQIDVGRVMLEYYCNEVGRQGQMQGVPAEIKYVDTHRKGHWSRVSDPGSKLFRGLVQWAIDHLGLRLLPKPMGSGRANPTAWTGLGSVPYSWNVRGY